MLTDTQLLATCIADEAGNQPYEGKVAVAIVVLNRMAAKYESDGTMSGTVLAHFQFSGFWFSMEKGRYVQTEFDAAGAAAEAQALFNEFSAQSIWADCLRAVDDAAIWRAGKTNQLTSGMSFVPGPQFQLLTTDTVLYYNPRVCPPPAWAKPHDLVATIFQHTFYRA